MRRKISELISFRAFLFLRHIPAVVLLVKNWLPFLLDYLGVSNKPQIYHLRNGLKIKTPAGSSGTIAVIFIKKDYGKPPAPKSVVIDIGSNIGVYALYASQSQGTLVYAYEPGSSNFAVLKENIEINGLHSRIMPFCFAISGARGKRTLYLGTSPMHSFLPDSQAPFHANFSDPSKHLNQKSVAVECISLKDAFDTNAIQRCDMLKIDCEGGEYDILYNLPHEYFSRIKNIRLEYHNHLNNTKNTGPLLIKFLQTKGFVIEKIKKGSEYQGDVWLKRVLS